MSTDNGDNWELLANGFLDSLTVNHVAFDPQNFLYAGTEEYGVLKSKSPIISDIVDEFSIPATYFLSQNYPNPFNPLTRFEYTLPRSDDVSLIIYDLRGHEVTRLVDKKQSAGYHQATWNASGMASGIYFYRLQAGDFVLTRKMLLLK